MADWTTPKTDWITNPKPPEAVDFNRIEGNIQHVFEQIEAKKGAIVSALNSKGQSATLENTYAELSNKIRNVIDSIETEVSFYVPSSGSSGDVVKTVYVDKPKSNGRFFMLIDLLENSEYRSLSVCDLQTFAWNSFAVVINRPSDFEYRVRGGQAIIRYRTSGFTGLQDIILWALDSGNQYRLDFLVSWVSYIRETNFTFPVKIFGKAL